MKANDIRYLLPDVFQRTLRDDSPLAAFLTVMEILHAPAERSIDQFPDLLDPRRTDDRFVPMLARWVDLDRLLDERVWDRAIPLQRLFPTGLGRLRELVAIAPTLSQWRGTARGLRLFLETATGLKGFEIDEQIPGEDGRPRPFHMRITCPAAARAFEYLIAQIIDSEKPAYVTCEKLHFKNQQE